MQEARPVPPFRCDQIEAAKLAREWKIWKESLECYFAAYDITDQRAMRAKLLHFGGPALQLVFKNLKDHDHVPLVTPIPRWYDAAVDKLNEFFEPRHQSTSERRKLRLMKQKSGERFADFIVRLKQQVAECGFERHGAEVSQILSEVYLTDAVVEGCSSNEVRRRILLKDLSFAEIEALGVAQEGVDRQVEEIAPAQAPDRVFKVDQYNRSKAKFPAQSMKSSEKSCFNCGRQGHIAISSACPARGKECRSCKSFGHFEKMCRKTKRSTTRDVEKKVHTVAKIPRLDNHSEDVKQEEEEKVYYAFYSGNESNIISCEIGGVLVDMLVDSGADGNLITEDTWETCKKKGIKVISSTSGSSRILRAYGSQNALTIRGTFVADIAVGDKNVQAEFFVVAEGQRCLLGDTSAKMLGVLKVGVNINSVEVQPFTKIRGIKARIRIDPRAVPVFQPMRRIPIPLEEAVGRKLDEMLKRDIIEVKTGPTTWVSPLVVVGKANGDPRLCLDLRRVNEAVLREHHPMPVIDDYLAKLGKRHGKGRPKEAIVWSKLDVKEAFLQVELDIESRDATTFITSRGLYRFKRLPFGLVTAPELFQKAMDEILCGCEGAFWYLDDVIVEGEGLTQHDGRLNKVLSRLKERCVELNWDKCRLRVMELDFLGHKISQTGIRPSKLKTNAILTFREPQNEAEVRSFLGLANYMNKFIPMLSSIDEPLRKLLHKDVKFEWTTEQANSFRAIKEAMSNVDGLGFYDVEDRTAVIADASPYGLGAILVQFDNNDRHRIISFASKSLTETERRYCQTEKEALGLVWAVERFQYYLLGKTFEIFTDCKALSFLFSRRSKPCARIERWVLRLQAFDYTVVFVQGKDNVADSLSRLSILDPKPFDASEEILVREIAMYAVSSAALVWKDIEEASRNDTEIQEIIGKLTNGDTHNLPIAYRIVVNELCELNGVLLRGDRIVIPQSLRDRVVQTAHEGHPGITMMKNHLRSNVWWPKMDAQVEKFVRNCRGCTLVAAPNPPEPMQRSILPSSPWHTVALDFLGPLPEGQLLLVVVDYYSRFIEVCEMDSTTTNDVTRELSIMFSRFGIPTILKADNGPQLSSESKLKEFCESHGVELRNTIPYWPQANGEVERQNRSILKRLKIAQELGEDWRKELALYLLTYHSTKHPSTGKSPAEIMLGRRIKSRLPTVSTFQEDADVRERDAIVKQKGKEYADKRRGAKPSDIKEGDEVVAKRMRKANKLETDFANEKFIVCQKKGADTFIKSDQSNKTYRRNSAHLKKIGAQPESSNRDEPSSSSENNDIIPTYDTEDEPLEKEEIPATNTGKRIRQQPAKYQDYIPH